MTTPIPAAEIFAVTPRQWGLRGDPHLWNDMRERLSAVPLPATEEELRGMVETMFQQLTGHPVSHGENIYLEKYSHGGMSSGLVHPPFWRDRGLPLLAQTWRELTSTRRPSE